MRIATACVNGVCTCLLPLPRNDFRPLALRHRSLAFVSAVLVSVKILALLAVAITPTTAELSTITVERVVQLTNAERQKAGEVALSMSPKLAAAAQRKGEDMLSHDYFAHISPSGVTPWFWMQQQNYTYQVAGENLAIDFVEVEDVVAAWLASPTHKDNMLYQAYTETGVAVVTGEFQGGTSTIVVHMFGLPAGSPSAEALAEEDGPTPTPATAGTQLPSPAPSATPTPTVVPTPLPDTIPPRTPRIALAAGVGPAVAKSLRVNIEADPESTVTLLVNNVPLQSAAAVSVLEIDIGNLPDGELVATAYAKDARGNTSPLSNILYVQKDSTGPSLIRSNISFILSPATDAPLVMGRVTAEETAAVQVEGITGPETHAASKPFVISLTDGELILKGLDELGNSSDSLAIALMPRYSTEADTTVTAPPQRLNRMSRWIIGGATLLILILLSLAIFVRIAIQRPALIAHASLVLLLAATLLFI